ncbi:uncharacterized protein [Aegilops tauschii subsp. strangulata]|uniref:uncharacterized protein n=1 Tax=Aegilops tauschii subsp. strangulata TaxID=200361 RepID=UPI003CC8CA81
MVLHIFENTSHAESFLWSYHERVLALWKTKPRNLFKTEQPVQHEIVSPCPQQEAGTNLCGYYVCRHMISICKSTDSYDDPRKLVPLILKPRTPESLPAGELLMVRRFISDFFLDHYINPTGANEDFSMRSPETLSKS